MKHTAGQRGKIMYSKKGNSMPQIILSKYQIKLEKKTVNMSMQPKALKLV